MEHGGFGGTLKLARDSDPAIVWFAQQPWITLMNTTKIADFSRKPNTNTNPWTPGRTNFFFQKQANIKGPIYSGMVTYVSAGESGKLASVMYKGPATLIRPDSRMWGFKMTTGVVSGSDNNPAATSFLMTGHDTMTGTGTSAVRNLVLVGGAVTTSAGGSNILLFHRVSVMDLTIVPEPAQVAGLAAGALGLLGLARWRRR